MELKDLNQRFGAVLDYLDSVILGKREVVKKVVIALLSRGHLLIEDVPGVGKTTMARSLANILECKFHRVSFTSDMMPSDILGTPIFNRNTNEFTFQEGPIFTNILLADELNRTTPKTQSAFLEAMEAGQVTIEKNTYDLPSPFLVMATQNPLEFSGTFPLPVSQLDRFLIRVSIGYPTADVEEKILVQYRGLDRDVIKPQIIHLDEVLSWQEAVPKVKVDGSLVRYITQLAKKTRENREIHLGVSPRATLALQRAVQAKALVDGRDYVTPDDIQEMLMPVWAHRIIMATQSGVGTHAYLQAEQILQSIVSDTPVPV
ncbi:MAG: MoxR family ATPase [Candidatus Omnitrophica bacterium]|nr:MoxR family ATPase [Candidatus Omnitrophota bacterium]MCA9417269.1 MoxR family ATPase [Candidatus Omnitrophota bacterium]MCA9425701.1 MoxR family ATPase [Candidatus Omnitrophota bacterium]MCA9431736.1 MoxR family ATPase [Candidatus Omnitrophota bacterium]MCA9436935.1 MoxR family ATPase [Candidatus Omnitrophota bacterium]